MKMNALAFVLAFVMAPFAQAQETEGLSVGAGLSTFGANLEAAYHLNDNFRLRGALMGGFSADYDDTGIDGDVEGEFNLGGLALLADYYFNQSGWRVSGGLFFSDTDLSATGTTDIDGLGDVVVTVDAKFENGIAPMVTTAYDWRFADGWSLSSEIGLIINGGIDVDFTASDSAVQDMVDDDEDVQDTIDDASDITVLPYVSLLVAYQF